jgi:capsid protein
MLYPVMNDLHDLDDLQLLEMKAARDAADITTVVKNKAGELNIEDAIAMGGAAAVTTDPAQKKCYYESTVGGKTVVLETGDEIQQFRSERPSVATRDYWVALEGKVCAGVGIPRQLVYPESIQGTVERSILDMQNGWFGVRAAALASSFVRIWHYVLADGIKRELPLADPPADWREVTWKSPRAINVDVGRNSTAMLAELDAGVRTRQQIWAEVGRDWMTETRQVAIEEKFIDDLAAEFGLSPDRIASSATPTPSPGSPPTEPADEAMPSEATTA